MITAITPNQGIGFQNRIPWNCPNDLKYFKRFTTGHYVIMGRKTYESIGKPLPQRVNLVVGKGNNDGVINIRSIEEGITFAKRSGARILWVIGGASIYDYFLKHFVIDGFVLTSTPEYKCDTFIKTDIKKYLHSYNYSRVFQEKKLEEEFTLNVYAMTKYKTVDDDYIDLMRRILECGEVRETRNGLTLSVFSEKISVDLTQGFPLLTTKKVFFNGVVKELLWFLKGETDSKKLEKEGVNIWKGNTTKEFLSQNGLPYEEGIGGPIYGYQWRHFGQKYDYEIGGKRHFTEGVEKGFDQIQFIIDEIKANPNSRRLFFSGWNPNQLNQMCLPPCHVSYQFYVQRGRLSCQMYQRSADVFLGLPFNIASTALLVHLIAKSTDLLVGNVHICIGDAHLYKEHLNAVNEQLSRIDSKYILPELEIAEKKDISSYNAEDIILKNYESHPAIKAKMLA